MYDSIFSFTTYSSIFLLIIFEIYLECSRKPYRKGSSTEIIMVLIYSGFYPNFKGCLELAANTKRESKRSTKDVSVDSTPITFNSIIFINKVKQSSNRLKYPMLVHLSQFIISNKVWDISFIWFILMTNSFYIIWLSNTFISFFMWHK